MKRVVGASFKLARHVLIGENQYSRTPSMTAGITDHIWSVEEVVKLA
jgi:hypothetical protein